MNVITMGVELTAICCPNCGGTFAISQEYMREAYRLGNFTKCWTCPYCKTERGYGEGEKQKQEREINRLRHEVDQKDAALCEKRNTIEHLGNVRRTLSGHITRIKNRVKNGVCPCCNRTFQNLAAHMTTKHPAYAKKAP